MGNTQTGLVPKRGSTRTDQYQGWNRSKNQNGDEICFPATHRRFCFYGILYELAAPSRFPDSHNIIARFRFESQKLFKAR